MYHLDSQSQSWRYGIEAGGSESLGAFHSGVHGGEFRGPLDSGRRGSGNDRGDSGDVTGKGLRRGSPPIEIFGCGIHNCSDCFRLE